VSVAGLVLAAGKSRRMGRPKMTLPWGDSTIIGHVVRTLLQAGLSPVIVVTGGGQADVEAALKDLPVVIVFNPEFDAGGMISSVHAGLRALGQAVSAALIVLGDQPQIQASVVQALLQEYENTAASLIVPSYAMRRGHPWLVDRPLWPDILALQYPLTLRDFLDERSSQIHYLSVDSASVIQDIDTPEQYEQYRPK
jgi:molybdenum cofactor cytidylyltransferase